MALTDSLVAFWKLDDNGSGGVSLSDSSGNSNSLSNHGSAVLATGKIGGCVSFDGTGGSYLSNANTFSASPSSGNSISLWVNPSGYATENNPYDGYKQAAIFYGSNTVGVLLAIDDSGHLRGSIGGTQFNTGQVIPTSAWTHIGFTQSGSSASIYINGSSIYDYSGSLGFWNTGQYMVIGQQANGAPDNGWPLNGKVDEIGIWSRAISSGEMGNLYNGGSGLSYPFALAGFDLSNSGSTYLF
jgi:Concanavalin A-like lectin/glucanases superfamily